MVAQVAYDAVVNDFLARCAEENIEVRNSAGTLYTYSAGAWGVISARETALFDSWFYQIAADHAFPVAEKGAGLWKTLKFRVEQFDADTLDAEPLLALPNGTLDPRDGTLYEHDPEHYTTRRLAIDYDPDATCPEWELMLDRILGEKGEAEKDEYTAFLQEFFGMACAGFHQHTPRDLRKALLLYGPKGTAKTSVADVLREFFRADEVCAESIDQIGKDFGLERLSGAKALISDDAVNSNTKTNPAVLKKLITGEPLAANRKYLSALQFRFRGPIVFTFNKKPDIVDESDAMFDRTVLLTFDYKFTREDKAALGKHGSAVPYLRAHGEFPGILNWALKGMARAMELRRFTDIAEAQESGRTWRAENDVVFDFLSRYGVADPRAFCSLTPLSRMISVYSADEHQSAFPPKKVAHRLNKEVGDVIPGAKASRNDADGTTGNAIMGLRIKPEGMVWEQIARERGMIMSSPSWKLNGKVL